MRVKLLHLTLRDEWGPNLYEASSYPETNSPYERFFSFFLLPGPGAVCSQLRVLT
jgi:hypothetical protein